MNALNNIKTENFYLLRTPLLPVQTILKFNKGAFAEETFQAIRQFLDDPLICEAIYIASPDLFKEYRDLLTNKVKDGKKRSKIIKSLYKYINRMSTRPTPYGLFAGCSTGLLGDETCICVGNFKNVRKKKRLDINYIAEIVSSLNSMPSLKSIIVYKPNNSIYRTGNKIRYTEFFTEKKLRSYRLSEVDDNEYLARVIKRVQEGATVNELLNDLIEFDSDLSVPEASEFINSLIVNQLLVSELEPTITGPEFYNSLVDKLKTYGPSRTIYKVLEQVKQLLARQEDGVEGYEIIATLINQLIPNTSVKDLVQVDMFRECEHNTINRHWVDDLTNHILQLFYLSDEYVIEDIEDFKKKFLKRYEYREIPLMEVLDPELGIGYAEYVPGTTDVGPFETINIKKSELPNVKWNSFMRYKLSKYADAIKNNKREIVIEQEDIARLSKGKTIKIPDQFYAMGNLISGEQTTDFILNNLMGPSACELMGRFCHGDEILHKHVLDLYRREQEKYVDTLFAEVIHLPPDRVGNILLRPVLRNYEIPFLGQSCLKTDCQISVNDIMVSIIDNQVTLRSKKLNKRIIPKLTSAHNYAIRNLSVYKFLCDIQYQGLNMGFTWDWGVLGTEPYLPRVRYKNIIVQKAQWLIKISDFSFNTEKDIATKVSILRAELQNLSLPQYVTINEADNLLPLNLESNLSVEILIDYLLKKKNLVVSEFLQFPEKCIVRNIDSSKDRNLLFTNEVIIPFTNKNCSLSQWTPPNLDVRKGPVKRHFSVGEEWLYFKIFCGTNTAEKILKDQIRNVIEDLLGKNIIKKFFFIRYFDPEPHIRLRCHLQNLDFLHVVVTKVHEELSLLIENEWINKIEVDTYKREVERYTDEFIEESELIFFYDSIAVMDMIRLINRYQIEEKQRWPFALFAIDNLLDDFDQDLESKASIMKVMQESFFLEFGGSNSLRHHLNDQYRKDYIVVQEAFTLKNNKTLANILEVRSKLIRGVLKPDTASKHTQILANRLLSSYVHMFCNRFFLSNHRRTELVLYHYLHKYYTSQLAKIAMDVKENQKKNIVNYESQ